MWKKAAWLLAAALYGCGGGGADEGGSAGMTRQEFVAKADAICAKANEKEAALGAYGPGWMGNTDQFDDPKFLTSFTEVGRQALRELEALKPPEEDRQAVAAVVESIDRMVEALDDRIAVLDAGGQRGRAEQVRAYEAGYGDLTTTAGPLGLSQCQGLLL